MSALAEPAGAYTEEGVWASVWSGDGALCIAGAALALLSLGVAPGCLMILMVFDSPLRGTWDLVRRWAIVAAFLSLPLLGLAGGVAMAVVGGTRIGGAAAAAAVAFGLLFALLGGALLCCLPGLLQQACRGRARPGRKQVAEAHYVHFGGEQDAHVHSVHLSGEQDAPLHSVHFGGERDAPAAVG